MKAYKLRYEKISLYVNAELIIFSIHMPIIACIRNLGFFLTRQELLYYLLNPSFIIPHSLAKKQNFTFGSLNLS